MDWSGIWASIVGAAIALVGVGLAELGQGLRARSQAKAAAAARHEDRRAELWQISIPAASRIQKEFADLVRKTSTIPSDPTFDQPPFDNVFPDWWEGKEIALRTDVALIPSREFRSWIESVNEGLTISWHLVRKVGYASNQEAAVLKVSQIGFEVISAWLRDERTIDAELLKKVDELQTSNADVAGQYEFEDKLSADAEAKRQQSGEVS